MINIDLKYSGYVSESKGHNYILEMAIPCSKRRLPLVAFTDPQAIVRILKIQLYKEFCALKPIHRLTNQG
jgi:hypothetical protein